MGVTTFEQNQRALPAARVARFIGWKGKDSGSEHREKHRATGRPPPIPLRGSHGHGHSKRLHGDTSESIPYSYYCIWVCCNCGRQGGMTVLVGQCPERDCQHHRCAYCPAEQVKYFLSDTNDCLGKEVTPRRNPVFNPAALGLHTSSPKTLLPENNTYDLHIITPSRLPKYVNTNYLKLRIH